MADPSAPRAGGQQSAGRRRDRARWTAAMIAEVARERGAPFAPADRLEAIQGRRVSEVVRYAHAHVPYYRETMRRRLLTPSDISRADQLDQLPLLEREAVQADPEYFCSELWPADRCMILQSGGTTGTPLTIFRDPPSLLLEAAHRERLRTIVARAAGRRLRYREASIRPPDSSVATAMTTLRRQSLLPTSLRVRRRSFSMFRPPAELLQEWAAFAPDVVSSYGSYIEALLVEVRDHGWSGRPPRVLTYSADAVSAELRDWARSELGLCLLGSYNAIEMPQIGFECEAHRGYHLNLDLCPLRLIDETGHAVTGSAAGHVVVSNLIGRASVLLNYRLGDLAARIETPCSCGRTLPLLSYLGRDTTAWLDFAGGRRIHAQALRLALRRERDVRRYQIVQDTPGSLLLRLVARPGCDEPAVCRRVLALLREQVPAEVTVRFAFLADLPRSGSHKVQPIVPLGSPAAEPDRA